MTHAEALAPASTDDEPETTDAPASDSDAPPERDDEDVLKELRERRDEATSAWADIRKEGQKDVMCVAGQVWEALAPEGLQQRIDAKRPYTSCDELGQYLNQVGNDVRQNKRGIRATPVDAGATDKTADFRQNLIRQIEYESNAQREVYSPVFEDSLQRGYGFGRVVATRVSELSRNYKLLIEGFPNPDVVLVDPHGAMLSPDCSKIGWAFVLDTRTRKQFKREFPDADVTDFAAEHARIAPDWIKTDAITIAEYWMVEQVRRRVVFLKSNPDQGLLWKTLKEKPPAAAIDLDEWRDFPYVCQYLTNGIELLAKKGQKKRTPWPGKSIPIFSCFGKVLYVQSGAGTERRLMSMVRLAREPVMNLAYGLTCKIETLGSVPRTTWIGYEGQFRGQEDQWAKANSEPVPYLQVKPQTEGTGAQILPLPVRQSWDPPLQNIEMACESSRRSIQAAMGTSPLPSEAQRVNQKSGKALDRIESSGQKGSFHFVDHLDGMICRVGVLLDDLIPHYYDAKRSVTTRKPNEQSQQVTINDPDDPESIDATMGHHDITISVGPSQTDARQAASDFADTIVGNQPLLQMVGPQKGAELVAQAIRLKDAGPICDEMADIISPKPEDGAPPTPQQLAEMQGQVKQTTEALQQAQQQIATDQAKQQATIEKAKIDGNIALQKADKDAALQIELQRMKNAASIEVAEIAAKTKGIQLGHDAAHEAAALHEQQAHELGMAVLEDAHEREAAQAAHDRALEQGAVAHEQGLESGEQGADLAMQQAEHAAEIAPEPAAGV